MATKIASLNALTTRDLMDRHTSLMLADFSSDKIFAKKYFIIKAQPGETPHELRAGSAPTRST
jgi:hypothetical protein